MENLFWVSVPVPMTEAEILEAGKVQASTQLRLDAQIEDLDRLIEAHKSAVAVKKEAASRTRAELSKLAGMIERKERIEQIEARIILDDVRFQVRTVRADNESIELAPARAMSSFEVDAARKRRQGRLFDAEAKAEAEGSSDEDPPDEGAEETPAEDPEVAGLEPGIAPPARMPKGSKRRPPSGTGVGMRHGKRRRRG